MRTTYRFWTWINDGWVKIKLHEGQSLRHCAGSATDEGWWSEIDIYRAEHGIVEREIICDGRDCDGRLMRKYTDFCPAAELAAVEIDGVWRPAWQEVNSRQRDYSAEAMGY